MSSINLNIQQERELARLLEYERATCSVNGELVYRCAFPFRPDDDLQAELIERGALMKKTDDQRGCIVTLTSDGYSYFPAKRKVEMERQRQEKREVRLIFLSGAFAVACALAGFLLGRFAG